MKEIIIATKNKGKAKEFIDFFLEYDIKALSLLDLPGNIPDVEETGTTFEENATLKAEQISELLQVPVLSDDSGLEIDALNGEPGVYSARYAGEEKNDQANVAKALNNLEDVPMEKRTARFVCVLAVAAPGEKTTLHRGTCEGTIATKPRGNNGFGYDPIFIPQQSTKTMAELLPQEKSDISHRANAIMQLDEWIKTL
ncbi:non-canonical purine NTP pyrophosphatase [Virgibacillus phasianinus]|uniref:dITP/XTP pyrophosphatase n=1 Tax=Virgibacillus phasianinus TaxID=2017483 RepID=A0A220U4L9_9BACI|nr:XTP/dITP diphosphatase [Virgibacillus phasianinus]ASK63040.1 non-canonical purine NTP pyrophosphatase [Virgibacillus phasianinus]